jgi:Uma2 family endonuclease
MTATAELVKSLADRVQPLRRAQYDRLVAEGAFGDERVELLQGVLVEMSPQDPRHADAVQWLARVLTRALPSDLDLRVQLPLAVGELSEPEPDLAVVPASRYRTAHPTSARLVIEVARSSQPVDLGPKVSLYAAAGIPEYWVVDLAKPALVVHLDPATDRYQRRAECRDGVLTAEAVPGLTVDLAELFG